MAEVIATEIRQCSGDAWDEELRLVTIILPAGITARVAMWKKATFTPPCGVVLRLHARTAHLADPSSNKSPVDQAPDLDPPSAVDGGYAGLLGVLETITGPHTFTMNAAGAQWEVDMDEVPDGWAPVQGQHVAVHGYLEAEERGCLEAFAEGTECQRPRWACIPLSGCRPLG